MVAAQQNQHSGVKAKKKPDSRKTNTEQKSRKDTWHASYIKWVVFVFALLLYADTLDLNYALDDSLVITQNTYTQKGVSGIGEIFSNDAFVGFFGEKKGLLPGGRYRPLAQVMFAVEKELFGFNPFIGHLVNILLYALTCMLLYIILLRLFKNFTANHWFLSIPFIASMLFAAHPLHTEVVANIKGRDEILSLLFSLLTAYITLQYMQNKKLYLLIINFFLFLLAVLSKENALTFIALIPLILYVFINPRLKDYIFTLLPLLLAFLTYFIIRIGVTGAGITSARVTELLNDPFVGASLMQKYATILLTWLKYLWLLIFPHPLTHDYYPKQIPIIGFSDPRPLLSLAIFGFLLIFSFIRIRKKNIFAFSILFFFISFSIVSNLVINIGTFMNERFMFTSLLGFTIIIAYLISVVLKKKINNSGTFRTTALIVFLVILTGYAVKTVARNRVWMDDLTLFTTDVRVSSNSTKCNTSAGGRLIEKADSTENDVQKQKYLDQAEKYLLKALEIYPQNSNALLLLGNAYFKKKEYEKSRDYYLKCLLLNPKNKFALNNLKNVAIMANSDKLYGEALKNYNLLLKYEPENAESYFGLGVAYKGLNKFDSAILILNKAIQIKPDYVDAISKLGEIYGENLNMIDEAQQCFIKAINIDPGNVSSLENLGIVYGIRHDYEKSIYYFKKALDIKPDKYGIYLNIAETYRIMGDKETAAEYLAKSEKYKPAGQ
ncbi:MAG TPA: tetratricopeptide repeat protein [Bacteroidales bacterium]|nr:tetratricopeptide repeat protein [Bacteroidales bacterium]